MSTNEEDLPGVIARLAEEEKGPDAVPILIKPTTNLYISSSLNLDISPFDVIISCTPEPLTTRHPEHLKEKKYLHFSLPIGKLGSRDLRAQLYRIPKFMESLPQGDLKFLVCDPTGKDHAVGVALAILCQHTDENGTTSNTPFARKMDKTYIKQRLTWITTTSPILNPSRETLKSVNSYLMPDASSASKFANIEHTESKLTLVDAQGSIIEPPTSDNVEPTPEASKSTTTEPSAPPPPPSKDDNVTTIFKNLHSPGTWKFMRTLRSALPTHPSGTVTGTATFTPFALDGQAQLYFEEGEFITDTGLRFTARRKYVYHLKTSDQSTEEDSEAQVQSQKHISVLFFYEDAANAADSGKTFVEMGDVTRSSEGVWEARNLEQHLCGEDWYAASWKFGAGTVGEKDEGSSEDKDIWWEVRYDVKGPQKDYVSETKYTRA